MPRFVVLSKFSAEGHRSLKGERHRLPDMAAEVERLGGRIIERYAMLGPYNFFSVIELRDNETAQLMRVADRGGETTARDMLPAIDLDLFIRLLGQSTANTGPYPWQISLPARLVRRVVERFTYTGVAKKYFKPFTVIGAENFDLVQGPALFIANHASFMDGSALYSALPRRYKNRVAGPAAADRFFIKGRKEFRKQGWWFSLMYNTFPMQRGGGRAALAYTDWLIGKGWSIMIFPEGARTSAAKLARFRMGPAILATTHGIPVVPMHLEGLGAIRPKGSREMTPGPVTVRVGRPITFPPGTDAKQANKVLYDAVDAMHQEAARVRREARAQAQTNASAPVVV